MSLNKKTILKDVLFLIAEAGFIFVSVYLAFMLNNHRIQNNHEHKRQQIYASLYNFFSTTNYSARNNRGAITTWINPFLKAYRKKKMPRLKKLLFFKSSISDRTWNAMLQSGGVDLLDVKLIHQISFFWGRVQVMHQETRHFNRMSDEYLLPYLDADISKFYNTKTKKIRPRYEWYVHYLRHFRDFKNRLEIMSKHILKRLKKKMNDKQLEKIKADSP